ncbi:hypothetical protein ACFWBI_07960 [Streptomyces sp. NPDC059982]|uniref:hypothetical protein n=1 Tax=unclassified Streptomyces TaxID=2593676 RepID=UPI0036C729F8
MSMRLRPLTNYERNIKRIHNPRARTLRDRAGGVLWVLNTFVCRHITHRALYRRTDALLPLLERAILARSKYPDP